jgi:hypothetical protein
MAEINNPGGAAIDAALEDRSWLSIEDPIKSLKALGDIIAQYAKPGSQVYESALVSAAKMGSRSHTNIKGETGALANFLDNNITYEQGKNVGINTLSFKIGSDASASTDPSGNIIKANDPYVRDRYNNIVKDSSGNAVMKNRIGDIVDPETGRAIDLSKLDTVPTWLQPSAEQIASGIIPGAKITPQMLADFESIRGVIGKGKSVPKFQPGGKVADADTGSTGVTSTGKIQNPYIPGTEEFKAFGERESAYNLLYQQMALYGLQSLVDPLKNLVLEGVSPSEFTIRLRDSKAYKQRFTGNEGRIQKGLRALSEAEYIGLEDQYQDVMRRYGLPQSYYAQQRDPITGITTQPGFEKFIVGDVSPVELEDRIQTAYNRVINANPEVGIALRNFYPGITNGDILAYTLDPSKALGEIQRKITAAEIGGAAVQAGLTTNEPDAQYLARYGITKQQAQQGYRTISGSLPRAQQLSSIYGNQVEGGPYTQASAEREIFNVPGAAEEERKRKKITSLERAAFSGSSGLTGGALDRERSGQY